MLETTDRKIRVLAVPVGDSVREILAESLPGSESGIDVTMSDAGPARAAEIVTREAMDAAVVATNGDATAALGMVERLVRARPALAVIMLCKDAADGFVTAAFAAGADDVLFVPETPDAVEMAIRKAYGRMERTRVGSLTAPEGRLIAVVGPKGGSGKTMTSTNLACALARTGARTLLVDLDIEFGDCAIVLGLAPERTIFDLVVAPGHLDEDKLRGYVTHHPETGLDVLIGPTRPDQADSVTVERVAEIFAVARHQYAFIVVDSAPAFSPTVIATVDAADEVVLLASMDVPSLKDARLGLDTLELMGKRRDDVRVVVNRATTKGGLNMGRVAEALDREIDVIIPSDGAVPSSYNAGSPVILTSPKSGVSKAIGELRKKVSGRADAERRSRLSLPTLKRRS